MASWGQRRQRMIVIGIGVLVLAVVVGVTYAVTYKAPSCIDHKQNQGEEGIDCGGPCPNACNVNETPLTVDFVRAVSPQLGRVDVIAYVHNPNTNAGARNASTTIKLYDQTNNLLISKTISINVPPTATVPVFIPEFYVGHRFPGQVFMTIASSSPTWPRTGQKGVTIIPKVNAPENSATPRVTATIVNPSAIEIDNLTLVVTVFDASRNAIAASQTVIKALPGSGSVPVVFTWNQPFPATAVSAEILPVQ